MKKIFFLLMPFMIGTQLSAQTTDSSSTSKSKKDTTSFKLGSMRVLMFNEEDKDSSKSERHAFRNKMEGDSIKIKKPKDHIPSYWGGLCIGTNGYMRPNQSLNMPAGYNFLELNQGKSINVSLNFADVNINLYHKYAHLVTGLGFEWNNYRFSNNFTLAPDSNHVSAVPSAINFRKNKLTTSYLTVPLLLGFNTNPKSKKHFFFATGVIGGLNLAAHTKQVYESGGKTYRDKVSDDYNLNPFKCDATVRIGYRNIAVYANYDMSEMFRSGRGPELHPFSVGIKFF